MLAPSIGAMQDAVCQCLQPHANVSLGQGSRVQFENSYIMRLFQHLQRPGDSRVHRKRGCIWQGRTQRMMKKPAALISPPQRGKMRHSSVKAAESEKDCRPSVNMGTGTGNAGACPSDSLLGQPSSHLRDVAEPAGKLPRGLPHRVL